MKNIFFSCATNQISDQVGILHASKSCEVEISHQMQQVFSIAYKYNLLIVLKILSYTLYREQLEEIERQAFSKIEQDSWSVPEWAKMDQHYPTLIKSNHSR